LKESHKIDGKEYILLANWIEKSFDKQSVADIGGGNGLLTYLLILKGFDSAVFDPVFEPLPGYYKNQFNQKIIIRDGAMVPYIDQEYSMDVAESFDLIVGLHAHEVNLQIIETTAKLGNNFVILPCCFGDEPVDLGPNANWYDFLLERAEKLGHKVDTFQLPFKGKNKGIYSKN